MVTELRKYLVSNKIYKDSMKIRICSDEYYHFLLIKSGNCFFIRDGTYRRCGIHELIMLHPHTSFLLMRTSNSLPLELVSMKLSTEILHEISREGTNLLDYFAAIPYDCPIITAENSLLMITKNLLWDLMKQEENPEFGDLIYRGGLISLIVILFARAFHMADGKKCERYTKPALLDSLLSYIREHITEEIPLARLEQEFNVSKRHILREFKKGTGQTVHEYIVKTKLSLCKNYLAQGIPVKQVYNLAGFGGYNHFFRAFKKEFHMTPGEFYRSTQKASEQKVIQYQK